MANYFFPDYVFEGDKKELNEMEPCCGARSR